MAASEHEILERLLAALRKGAEAAYRLSQGERGFAYLDLMREMKTGETCCRQMAFGRDDTRWLPLGLKLAEVQKRAGAWLRAKEPSWRFKGLAEILAAYVANSDQLARKKTGRRGLILPKPGFEVNAYNPPLMKPPSQPRSKLIVPR
jgi:hypothetical protein